LLSSLFVIIAGCASLSDSVIRLSAKGKYREALTQLEKKGVGTIPLANAKPKDLEARSSYEAAVSAEYKRLVQAEIAKGSARMALRLAMEGQELCVWSEELKETVTSCRGLVENIDRISEEWEHLAQRPKGPPSSIEIKTFLLKAETISNLVADSPRAQEILRESRVLFEKYLQDDLRRQIKQKNTDNLSKLVSDLGLVKIPKVYVAKIIKVAENLIILPWSEREIDSQSGRLSERQLQCLQDIITIAESVSPPRYQS